LQAWESVLDLCVTWQLPRRYLCDSGPEEHPLVRLPLELKSVQVQLAADHLVLLSCSAVDCKM